MSIDEDMALAIKKHDKSFLLMIVEMMEKDLAERQGFITDDQYTMGWRRGWSDAAAVLRRSAGNMK